MTNRPCLIGCWRDNPQMMKRALKSAAPFISGVSISVDPDYPEDEQHLLRLCAQQGLPHNIYQTKRSNGGELRTTVMVEGEKYAKKIGAQWLLFLDADDYLEFDAGFSKWTLDSATVKGLPIPAWQLTERIDTMSTPSKRLFRVGLNWAFKFPLHELPYCDASPIYEPAPIYPRITYVKKIDGDRSADRYARHAEIIENWLRINEDPDGYMAYYLGQSLQADNRFEEAKPIYEKFLHDHPTAHNSWRASLHLALGTAERGDSPQNILRNFIRMIDVAPTREEPYKLIELFAQQMLAQPGIRTPPGSLMRMNALCKPELVPPPPTV